MKKLYLLLVIGFFLTLKLFAQSDFHMSIYFGAGKYQLLETDQKKLNLFVEQIKSSQKTFLIEGHCSDEGSEGSNFSLAAKRIKSVSDYLQSKEVDISKAETKNWGETRPTYLKTNDNMRAMNRRVDIIIPAYSGKKNVVSAKEIYRLVSPSIQEFCIDNKRDTSIVGMKGSVIYFAKNSFNQEEVNNCKCITIKMEELFSKADIIMAAASTITADAILESKGMLNVTAHCNGKELQLAGGKKMAFILPNASDLGGLGVFYGDRDSSGNLLWAAAKKGERIARLSLDLLSPCSVFDNDTSKVKCWFRYSKAEKQIRLKFLQQVRDSLAYCDAVTAEQKALMDEYGIDNLEMLNKKIEESAAKTGKIGGEATDYYILSALKLGYINADWILKLDPEKLITIKIPLKNARKVKAYLVFDEKRTVVPASVFDNEIAFGEMPIGYGAKIFAIMDNESGATWAWQEFVIEKDKEIELDFKAADINEIKLKLNELDGN